MVNAWHGMVPMESTLEPSLPLGTLRASKAPPASPKVPPKWGLALVGSHMAEALGAEGA